MERVALYMRVSTEEQARHGLSLAEQDRTLTDYAKENHLQIIDKYTDGGISARKRYNKRPELMRLLEDVEAEKIDTILFIKLDRWFRNVADYYEVQKILDEHDVKWRATQEDYETVTASGRFKVNIMLSVAQDEADRTSERIKFVFEGKRAKNEITSGIVPKGYKIENKHIIKDPEQEDNIRQVFEMFWNTGSPAKIIEAFPELHLNYQSVRKMLTSRAYLGEYSGIHIPPYITEEEYNRTQAIRASHDTIRKNHFTYLFSGLLYCPCCGNRLYGQTEKKSTWQKTYYTCGSYWRKMGCTNNKFYNEDMIENYLLDHIESQVQATITAQKKSIAKSYKPQRDSIQRKISKLQDLYINEMIDLNEYRKKYTALQSELAQIPQDEPQTDTKALQQTFTANWKDLYCDLPREGKQEFWHKTIEKIILSEDGSVKEFIFRKNIK